MGNVQREATRGAKAPGDKKAVFLDRDGTLVLSPPYPTSPTDLELYPGVHSELAALQRRGFLLVIVTNQSAVARGYLKMGDLERIHDYLQTQLLTLGVTLDGVFVCPHHPDGIVPEFSSTCNCRKPEPGLLMQAAHSLGISLASSWLVGDAPSDIEAGKRCGCRTIRIGSDTHAATSSSEAPDLVAPHVRQALTHILQAEEEYQQFSASGTDAVNATMRRG